ncbi:Uncharacterized protein Adt_41862 [Abeliophyllum distichum]|uniref:Uncharacterized protein n=1 Tax=Abeliophyllum distichum TaxID=126358 RepID=A0ABD1PQ17_9LAMI
MNYHLHTCSVGTGKNDSISFTPTNAVRVHVHHNDVLRVLVVMARNGLERMLVDDISKVNIIYGATYDKMGIEAHLILATYPIYGFTRNSIVLRGTIVLMTEIGDAPTTVRTPMEYLVINKSSSYHGVLGRSALIDLEEMTHTKFLCMKFSTYCGISIVRGNQSESKEFYTNTMRKFVDQEVNVIDVEMKEDSSDLGRLDNGPNKDDEHMMEQKD